MIICRQCSHSNPDGTPWCQKCNAFLEFEGEPQAATPSTPSTPGQAGAAAPVVPGPPAEAPPVNRGESLVARPGDKPPADAATAPRQPGEADPVVPDDSTTRLPTVPPPDNDIPPIRPGEIVCPTCGWGNEPTRRFCRHDGAVLAPAGGQRGQVDALKAGQRRRRTGGSKRGPLVLAALLVPALVAAAVFGVIYLRPKGGDDSGRAGGNPSPTPSSSSPAGDSIKVAPGAVKINKVTSQSGGRVAANLLDGKPETFWSVAFPSGIPNNPKPDIDRRPRVTFDFTQPVTVTKVEIINGASGPEFAQRPRARVIQLLFQDGTRQTFELADQNTEFQTIQIEKPVKGNLFAVQISTSYPGTATDGDRYRFSLAEVRFFIKA